MKAGQESAGDEHVLSHCSLLRNPSPKMVGVLAHCSEGETSCWFPIFRKFPSDRIPKAKKDVNVHFYIYSSSYCMLYERIPGTF